MSTPKFCNNSDVPLSVAAWLAYDDYDYNDDPNTISVTTLLKPIRQLVLGSRVQSDPLTLPTDVISLVKSRIGQSIHSGIENVWLSPAKYTQALTALNLPTKVIKKIKVNPIISELVDGDIPVFIEQRIKKKLGNITLSGKFDMCFNGQLEDNKSTSTFTYVKGVKEDDYILQGSIYRWLDPTIITKDTIRINYIFTDYKEGLSYQKGYPPAPQVSVEYPLMTLEQTEKWIKNRLALIEKQKSLDETEIILCTDEELWRGEDTWKYYKKSKAEQKRATKNFDDELEAKKHYADQGFAGELVKVPGEVKACNYCRGYELCTQKNTLILAGDLKVRN